MNYVWLFFLLLFGACGYFEYSNLQDKIAANDRDLSAMQAKVDATEAAKQKLESEKKALAQSVELAQNTVADLSAQLRADEQALTLNKVPVPGGPSAPAPKPPAN